MCVNNRPARPATKSNTATESNYSEKDNDNHKQANMMCLPCVGKIECDIDIYNELTEVTETIRLSFKIIDIKHDFIIGMSAIIKNNLLYKLFSHFSTYLTKDSFLQNLFYTEDSIQADIIDQSYMQDGDILRRVYNDTLGIIEKSPDAKAWSHVLLVKKPNGTWRFCIDFRAFNQISEMKHWPIPNIKNLLMKLGQRRPKFFAVMDLPSSVGRDARATSDAGSGPRITDYPNGSWVLYSGEGSITASRTKLDTLKAGPFQVKSHEGSSYVITDVVNHKDREVHVTKLHPF
eukprot:gene18727-26487_t